MAYWTETFDSYFAVKTANTPALIQQAMRVRYEMYCLENDYEDATQFENEQERDPFDVNSVHSLLIFLPTNSAVGTVRLILPVNGQKLPIEEHCQFSKGEEFSQGNKILDSVKAGEIAEVSRFSISKSFRKRLGESSSPHGIVDNEESLARLEDRRFIPHLTVGLVRAAFELSHENGISKWFAVMEPTLKKSLMKRYHMQFFPIGQLVDFRGLRQPYIADLAQTAQHIRAKDKMLWKFLTDDGRFLDHIPQPQIAPAFNLFRTIDNRFQQLPI